MSPRSPVALRGAGEQGGPVNDKKRPVSLEVCSGVDRARARTGTRRA